MPQDPVVRERARKRADQARIARGALKRALKAGEVDPFDLLGGNAPQWEDTAKRMTILALLVALPGIGDVTAREALAEVGVETDTRVYGLTYQLRRELATTLRAALS